MVGGEVEVGTVKTCGRCGTFAVLESNGFRELCGPCWATVRHRLDRRLTSIPEMAESLVRLIGEYWKPALAVVLIKTLPLALMVSQRQLPLWITLPYHWVVGSFLEAVLITIVGLGALGGVTQFPKVLRAAEARYLAAIGVNVLTTLLVMAGTVLLCAPGAIALAFTFAAIPIAVLEGLPAHRAFLESVRRGRPIFWRLTFFATILLVLSALPSLLMGFYEGLSVGAHRQLSPETSAALRVGGESLGALVSIPGMLMQLVAWAATRPAPVVVPGAPSP